MKKLSRARKTLLCASSAAACSGLCQYRLTPRKKLWKQPKKKPLSAIISQLTDKESKE